MQFSSDSDAQTKYNALLSGIQSDSGNAVDTSTYRKYTVEIGDLYHVLIKNGNVVLYGSAGVAEKEERSDSSSVPARKNFMGVGSVCASAAASSIVAG